LDENWIFENDPRFVEKTCKTIKLLKKTYLKFELIFFKKVVSLVNGDAHYYIVFKILEKCWKPTIQFVELPGKYLMDLVLYAINIICNCIICVCAFCIKLMYGQSQMHINYKMQLCTYKFWKTHRLIYTYVYTDLSPLYIL